MLEVQVGDEIIMSGTIKRINCKSISSRPCRVLLDGINHGPNSKIQVTRDFFSWQLTGLTLPEVGQRVVTIPHLVFKSSSVELYLATWNEQKKRFDTYIHPDCVAFQIIKAKK